MEQFNNVHPSSQPIAIVGIGCRFPGGVNSPDSFWRLLTDQVDAIREIPQNRFDSKNLYDPRPAVPGKIMTRWGGFLDSIDQFDAAFFGISPREADRLDPQQRLLLEVAWEAIEDAGEVIGTPNLLNGGAFVGVWLNDYETRLFRDPAKIDFYMTTGSGRYSNSGRLSYFLGMQGPSLTVDTACSSSLVAVHLACQSLKTGECSLALAGGTSVILQPSITIAYSQSRMMAQDGHCKFGDARADGYVRSEGTALLALKRLSDAVADGNPIYAIIKGSAVNNDGRSSGFLTTPGGIGQEDLLRKAYQDAGVSPGKVQYIEAHGTGTRAGDPVEIQAIGNVVRNGRPEGTFCRVGSVKTNFGHTEGAAGVAGLIKVALSLKNNFLPASLHFQSPSPQIPWDQLPVRIQAQPEPWPDHDGPALAGVSAFGIAGTNAHVVLEEAPKTTQRNTPFVSPLVDTTPYLVPLSARSPEALRDLAKNLHQHISGDIWHSLQDISYTTSIRRSHHDYRAAFTANTIDDLRQQLSDFSDSWQVENSLQIEPTERKILFVFPGQGSQWVGMGRQLMEREPAFRLALEQCSTAIQRFTGWSLIEILCSDDVNDRMEQIDFIQPTLFAMQAALGMLWRSRGIEPAAVVGHSLGEVAAAFFAGVLSLEDAASVICKRSQLMRTISGKGAMLATDLSYSDAENALVGYENRVSIAVSNSAHSTVLSGDVEAIDEIMAVLQKKNVFCRPVKVDVAAHSPQMEPLRPILEQSLKGLEPKPELVPVYSTVTGKKEKGSSFNIAYWGLNLRQPVLFSTVIQQALADGIDTVIEISPHPILLQAVEQAMKAAKPPSNITLAALPSARRGEDESRIMMQSIGRLYELGHPLDMKKLISDGGRCVSLPNYPWQREHFWLEIENPSAGPTAGSHPLSGRAVGTAGLPSAIIREIQIESTTYPELYAQRLYNTPTLPASAYIEIVRAAVEESIGVGPYEINDLVFERAIILENEQKTIIQIVLTPSQKGQYSFQIASQSKDEWLRHAVGTVKRLNSGKVDSPIRDLATIQQNCQTNLSGQSLYASLKQHGIIYDAPLQIIHAVDQGEAEMLTDLTDHRGTFRIIGTEPLFQLSAAVLPYDSMESTHDIFLPSSIESVKFFGPVTEKGIAYASILSGSDQVGYQQELVLCDYDGNSLVEIHGLYLRRSGQTSVEHPDQWLYELDWQPTSRIDRKESEPVLSGNWIVLADHTGQAEVLAKQLEAAGNTCTLISSSPDEIQTGAALRHAIQNVNGNLQGIIHMGSLDLTSSPSDGVDQIEAQVNQACMSAVETLKEAAAVSAHAQPRLWFITRGAQMKRSPSHLPSISQSALWGLGRVIAEEHSELWGGLIDVDPDADLQTTAQALAAEVTNPQETQLAFANGHRRLALRLVPYLRKEQSAVPYQFRSDSAYIITGGLGGIGLEVAHWMINQGARRLILMNRTPLPPRNSWIRLVPEHPQYAQVQAVQKMEQQGATIHLAAVDVGDETSLTRWVEQYNNEALPTIRGVIHAAGITRDRLVTQMNLEDWNAVIRPKIRGSWLLHQLLPNLDLFVLFSSIGSIYGPIGQGSYAAANAFLDGLTQYRRNAGLSACSINWGFWDNVGLAKKEGAQQTLQALQKQGLEALNASQATTAFGMLLSQNPIQAAVMSARWNQVTTARLSSNQNNLFIILTSAVEQSKVAEADQPVQKVSIREALLALPIEKRSEFLASFLQTQIAQVLKLPISRIPLTKPLGPLGLDSLMAIELRGRLEEALSITLSATFVWSYPTVSQMTPFVAGRMDVLLTQPDKVTEPIQPEIQQDELSSLESLDTLFDQLITGIEELSDENTQDTLLNE